ncbi:cdc25-like protein phosphatase twine-related [Anaeramoeba ignava]|uniref:protein-tyrosine-phosphatase n=1 Tax=Anaeramoeba ignava TaxID=1746090 RepID=A0A9Q0L9F5_ANAIG|nr:cdc25-like protein phosphatase twine-related [Anaeramoeba ignava]
MIKTQIKSNKELFKENKEEERRIKNKDSICLNILENPKEIGGKFLNEMMFNFYKGKENETNLESIPEDDFCLKAWSYSTNQELLLPLSNDNPPEIPTISIETMIDLLTGKYSNLFDFIFIIDCRFPYEYEGGHIMTAVNWFLAEKLFQNLFCEKIYENSCIIFHCEFSINRAVETYNLFRRIDRKCNDYPKLFYPQAYVLGGGYSKFFTYSKENIEFCEPKNYVQMKQKKFRTEMKHFSKLRRISIQNLQRLHSISYENIRDFYSQNSFNPQITRSISQPVKNLKDLRKEKPKLKKFNESFK